MLGQYLKRLFGGKIKGGPKFGPHKITLDTTVSISSIDILPEMTSLNPEFCIPTGSLSIHEIGTIGGAEGQQIIRLYCTDDNRDRDFMLQLVIGKLADGKDVVDEVTLFVKVDEKHPTTTGMWDDVVLAAQSSEMVLCDKLYTNIWGANDAPDPDLEQLTAFVETRFNRNVEGSVFVLYSSFFGRTVPDSDIEETVLVVIENYTDEDIGEVYGYSRYVGIDLNVNSVSMLTPA